MARSIAEAALAPLGLRLHPDKTRIVHLTRGAEGFDFLGFHHHMVESWKWPGRYYLQQWPSARAMASLRTKVREMTDRRYVGLSLDVVVQRLNPVLRGWAGYFRHGNSARKFSAIDSYVAERMAILVTGVQGLAILGVGNFVQDIFYGAALILSVAGSQYLARSKLRRVLVAD